MQLISAKHSVLRIGATVMCPDIRRVMDDVKYWCLPLLGIKD